MNSWILLITIIGGTQLRNLIQKRNLRNLRPCIFLDRDGTINKERGYISKHKNFELLPKAAEAIKLIK